MDLKQKAVEIFTIHTEIEKIYMTSDGQGFTEEHHATDHARILTDKKVSTFTREQAPEEPKEPVNQERKALMQEYELLFGEKPVHNIGTDTLKAKIDTKKAEDLDVTADQVKS